MKKSLIGFIALAFALAVGVANANNPKEDAIVAACKDKKPGTEVTVDGKKTLCPEPKKADDKKKSSY